MNSTRSQKTTNLGEKNLEQKTYNFIWMLSKFFGAVFSKLISTCPEEQHFTENFLKSQEFFLDSERKISKWFLGVTKEHFRENSK